MAFTGHHFRCRGLSCIRLSLTVLLVVGVGRPAAEGIRGHLASSLTTVPVFPVNAEVSGRPTPSTCIHQTPRQTLHTRCRGRSLPQPQEPEVTLALDHRWADGQHLNPEIGTGWVGRGPTCASCLRGPLTASW